MSVSERASEQDRQRERLYHTMKLYHTGLLLLLRLDRLIACWLARLLARLDGRSEKSFALYTWIEQKEEKYELWPTPSALWPSAHNSALRSLSHSLSISLACLLDRSLALLMWSCCRCQCCRSARAGDIYETHTQTASASMTTRSKDGCLARRLKCTMRQEHLS